MNKEENTIQDLFSDLSPKERKEAKQNLQNYLKIVGRIYDNLDEKEKQKLLLKLEWEKRNLGKNSASQK
jgi:hypothetical protein